MRGRSAWGEDSGAKIHAISGEEGEVRLLAVNELLFGMGEPKEWCACVVPPMAVIACVYLTIPWFRI
jgi:hypothetical protein